MALTTMWLPLLADTWLVLTLLKLAIPADLCYMGHLFEVDQATAGKATLEVCGALQDMLGHMVFQVHDSLVVVAGFHVMGFSQCIGAWDRTNISITCPPHSDYPHCSWRGFYSIVLLPVIGHCGAFTNMSASWVGSAHNTRIFCNSTLPALMQAQGKLFCEV
ncbi:hypothetical protein Y1Q_0022973 [Alligator mississippiensis]|uniref:Uncharacterized protein n=1 Tax=Alligator mississippiensis TaxID=8496 RepID=A0A151P791_ALLMI|nr:hypothetical protein Y1Q_0022973 [Alligator mississippiensis]